MDVRDITAAGFSLPTIQRAILTVYDSLSKSTPDAWKGCSEGELWRELVLCILSSRVKFETAYEAVERMDSMNLLSQKRRGTYFDQYEQEITVALSKGYPFYRRRAHHIRRAAEFLYGTWGSISELLASVNNLKDIRRLLTLEVAGLGPKQASLFLRNIGYARRIAILDTHVLSYLNWIGLTDAPLKSVSTLAKYQELEECFIKHADSLGCSPDQFDFAVWIVVGVVKEESKVWES